MIQIVYFARVRELTGKSMEEIQYQSMRVQELLDWVEATYPQVQTDTIQVAIDEEFVPKDTLLSPGDICVLIPLVSGG